MAAAMMAAATDDLGWAARVTEVGVSVELFDADLDDDEFARFGAAVMDAAWDSTLSDHDLYPLLVKFWIGRPPPADWPPHAPTLARRCAVALATRGGCELEAFMYAPTDQSLHEARTAIVAELRLTPGGLLSVLADHWQQLASLPMPHDGGRTLLAFARHVLLEPVVGACALMWSTLDSSPSTTTTAPAALLEWGEWSPVASDDWLEVALAELSRLGRSVQRVPADADEAGDLLAFARAATLKTHGTAHVAASIARTSGWPGDTKLIDPLVNDAVESALQHIAEVDPESDNDDAINSIQSRLAPCDAVLNKWIRDPSFGRLSSPTDSASTGAEMLDDAVDGLTWSLSRAAVETVAATRRSPPDV